MGEKQAYLCNAGKNIKNRIRVNEEKQEKRSGQIPRSGSARGVAAAPAATLAGEPVSSLVKWRRVRGDDLCTFVRRGRRVVFLG